MEPPRLTPESPSRPFRFCLGIVLAGAGLALVAAVVGILPGHGSPVASRGLLASVGVALIAAGVQVGQWAGASGRLYDAVGAILVTAMATMTGWVALYGDERGFSTTVSGAGLSVTFHGAATLARVAFGTGAALMGLMALWAWRRVLRPRP